MNYDRRNIDMIIIDMDKAYKFKINTGGSLFLAGFQKYISKAKI